MTVASPYPTQTFSSDGISIAYFDVGEGDPILLIHGFASSKSMNWVTPGWVDTLLKDGRRVIALDNRGHGESEKLYDSAAYPANVMAGDAARLIDHLGLERVDVMGYSMGARISAFLSLAHPEKVRSVVFGGLGIGMIRGVGGQDIIVSALEAPSLAEVTTPLGRKFRQFAQQTGSDLKALAACMSASNNKISADDIGGLKPPALIAVGTTDDIAGSAEELAALIPGSKVCAIPDRDHMLAVGDKVYKDGVLAFLAERP
ncbi:pimeloyl-ACP methyl ester carboxylesterase [Amorphus suaedae]